MSAEEYQEVQVPTAHKDHGLPEGFIFCNFGSAYKFDPDMFKVWCEILSSCPGSILWLSRQSRTCMDRIQSFASENGVNPDRIIFAPTMHHNKHIERISHADCMLDTMHHGGGATITDALWAGVPVITLRGNTPPARNGASILTALDIPGLIRNDINQYKEAAIEMTKMNKARVYKEIIQQHKGTKPLFNTRILTKHIEWAYEEMYRLYVEEGRYRRIDVPLLPMEETE